MSAPQNPLSVLSQSLADAVATASQSIVTVNGRQRMPATGIHWRTGIIVTADHVVERDDELTVTLPDGQTVPASLIGRDPSTDIAALKVDGLQIPAATFADEEIRIGQFVLALGRAGSTIPSASFGVISTANGPWRTGNGGQIDQLVSADITMYPGFSGGPLVNSLGQVLGVNTSHLTRSFAITIPAVTVNKVLDQLLSHGRIARGYLGLYMQPLRIPDPLKAQLSLSSDSGLIVMGVESGSPAEQGGFFIGDILLTIDNTPISDTREVHALLTGDKIGQTLQVQIIRGGNLQSIAAIIGERSNKES
jgi:serine protease DegQ